MSPKLDRDSKSEAVNRIRRRVWCLLAAGLIGVVQACSLASVDSLEGGTYREQRRWSYIVLSFAYHSQYRLVFPDDTRGSTVIVGRYRMNGELIILEPSSEVLHPYDSPIKLVYESSNDTITVTFQGQEDCYEVILVREWRY